MKLEVALEASHKLPHIAQLQSCERPRTGKPTEKENRLVGAQGWKGKNNGGLQVKGKAFLWGSGNKNIPKIDYVELLNSMIIQMPLNYIL